MEAVAWCCDRFGCENTVHRPRVGRPDGWFQVFPPEGRQQHFCSIGCLSLAYFRTGGWELDDDGSLKPGQTMEPRVRV